MKNFRATYDVWSFAFGMEIPFERIVRAESAEDAQVQVAAHNPLAENIKVEEVR